MADYVPYFKDFTFEITKLNYSSSMTFSNYAPDYTEMTLYEGISKAANDIANEIF